MWPARQIQNCLNWLQRGTLTSTKPERSSQTRDEGGIVQADSRIKQFVKGLIAVNVKSLNLA